MTNVHSPKRAVRSLAAVFSLAAAISLAASAAAAQAPALPGAPASAPQDSGALRVQVQGTLTDAQKNDATLESATKSVASQLRCPVCQGLSIQDSPSELSQQMRTVVKEQLAAGKSQEQVKDYFISKYGEWILLEPQAHGFNVLIYAIPALLVVGGAIFIVFIVKKWTAAGPVAAGAEVNADDD